MTLSVVVSVTLGISQLLKRDYERYFLNLASFSGPLTAGAFVDISIFTTASPALDKSAPSANYEKYEKAVALHGSCRVASQSHRLRVMLLVLYMSTVAVLS